jgi:nicotinate-nucleotide adenylyltransferase
VPSLSRIGVLGSLCNPPHLGHAALARVAAEQLDLESVLLVPTGVPAHREPPLVSAGMRLRLALAAAADEPVLLASSVEVDRAGPSYMADTLEQLARAAGDAELVLLLGADQYATLDEWHDPERLRSRATIAVAPRPGVEIAAGSATLIAMPEMDIASSVIRRRIASGESIDGLVSPSVAALIAAEGLYQSGGAG